MEYKSGEDVRNAVRSIMHKNGVTLATLAENMGSYHGNLSRHLNKLNPSFNTIRDMVSAMGYKLVFDIVPKDASDEVKDSSKAGV